MLLRPLLMYNGGEIEIEIDRIAGLLNMGRRKPRSDAGVALDGADMQIVTSANVVSLTLLPSFVLSVQEVYSTPEAACGHDRKRT
jgi:hypothetical protein